MNISKLASLFLGTAFLLLSAEKAGGQTTIREQQGTPESTGQVATSTDGVKPQTNGASIQANAQPISADPFQGDQILLTSKFNPQLGLGITILPAQGVWNGNWLSYFQAGLTGNIDVRVAERLSMRFSLGGIGSDSVDMFGSTISEFLASTELRVHLHRKSVNPNRLYLSPFLLAGVLFNFATLGYSDGINYTYPQDYASYLGGMLGVGIEFRFGRNFSIDLDFRGILQGALRVSSNQLDPSGKTFFDSYRGGVRVGVGAVYYF